ncbi:hypothetical protein ACWGJP_12055 [Microbacterium sp. NPDC055903]
MSTLRTWSVTLSAVGLVGGGGFGIVLNVLTWMPCAEDQGSAVCLALMDRPPHLATMGAVWVVGVILALLAVVSAESGRARGSAVVALLLILTMNAMVEYALWLMLAGGHWDVPPGTGYFQACALVVAGLVILSGAFGAERAEPRASGALAFRA